MAAGDHAQEARKLVRAFETLVATNDETTAEGRKILDELAANPAGLEELADELAALFRGYAEARDIDPLTLAQWRADDDRLAEGGDVS